jgi:hypothetical protein
VANKPKDIRLKNVVTNVSNRVYMVSNILTMSVSGESYSRNVTCTKSNMYVLLLSMGRYLCWRNIKILRTITFKVFLEQVTQKTKTERQISGNLPMTEGYGY